MFFLLRGKRHRIQQVTYLTWHREIRGYNLAVLDIGVVLALFPIHCCWPTKHQLKLEKVFTWDALEDNSWQGGLFPTAICTLYFPRQHPGDAHAVHLHGVQYFSSGAAWAQLTLQEQQRCKWRSPVQRDLMCYHHISLAVPAMEHCLPFFPGDWLTPRQIMTRYFS